MGETLQDVITAVGAKLSVMTGLTRWYYDPPEALAEFPCGLAYVSSGYFDTISQGSDGRHTITINIYHSRQVLPSAIDAAKVWPYRVLTALAADVHLNSTVAAIVQGPPGSFLRYRFGPLQYGNDVHYGMTCDITVKVIGTLTVA